MEISKHKNSQVMPLIKPYTGLRLPPDRYCLSAPNYRMSSHKAVKKVRSPIALMRGLPLCSNSSILKSMVNFFIRMYSMMAKIAIFFKGKYDSLKLKFQSLRRIWPHNVHKPDNLTVEPWYSLIAIQLHYVIKSINLEIVSYLKPLTWIWNKI